MNVTAGIIASVIAGIIGAVIWAAIVHFTGYEVGFVAWGIGGLVGFSAVAAAGGAGHPGVIATAVIVTILSIVGGKYAAIHIAVNETMGEMAGEAMTVSDDDLRFEIVDSEALRREMAGETVNWPAGIDYDSAVEWDHFPADLRMYATQAFNSMSIDEREAKRDEIRDNALAMESMFGGELRSQVRTMAFKESFGVLDIVFFLLAIGTAFKITAMEGE